MGKMASVAVLLVAMWVGVTQGQRQGAGCTRADGTRGVCQDMRECLEKGGSTLSAGRVQVCSSNDFDRVIVCCRSSAANFARRKCGEWQQQRLRSGSACTVTIPLVRGGEDAHVGEFPHIVSLQEETPRGLVHVCGGSLIAADWVLTAAHCIQPNSRLVAVLGAHDLRELERGISFPVNVLYSVVHPHYQGFNSLQRYNDIGLLRLQFKPPVTLRIQPACLPYTGERVAAGQQLVVAGWGKTGPAAPVADVLKRARVGALGRLQCDRNPSLNNPRGALTYPAGITDSILCISEVDQGSCQGDSGGPLMVEGSSGEACVQTVVGLVSRGIMECTSTTVPGIYTNVAYYLDWIVDTIWRDEV